MDRIYCVNKDHCPWMGTCIGHNNRQYFINFLTYVALVAIVYICMMLDFHMKSKIYGQYRKRNLLLHVFNISGDWSVQLISLDNRSLWEDNSRSLPNIGWLHTFPFNFDQFPNYIWNQKCVYGFTTNMQITAI